VSREAFEKWAEEAGFLLCIASDEGYAWQATESALKGWNARQPEIDALKAEVKRLRKDAEERDRLVALFVEWWTNDDCDNAYYFNQVMKCKSACAAMKEPK
jgi:hypothetical protein